MANTYPNTMLSLSARSGSNSIDSQVNRSESPASSARLICASTASGAPTPSALRTMLIGVAATSSAAPSMMTTEAGYPSPASSSVSASTCSPV